MSQAEIERLRQLYIETIKLSVGDFLYDFDSVHNRDRQQPYTYVDYTTGARHILRSYAALKENGLLISNVAHTLIGLKRLNQLQAAVETVLAENIPGDLIETGVLRGGACIFMRAILKAYLSERTVWVADSFAGFPGEAAPTDEGRTWYATRAVVEDNFRRYQLWDAQVQILAGWFKETLAQAPIQQLAVLRLDGDLYDSTWDTLEALYPKVSPGGFVIVDDFYAFEVCRQAVRDYRKAHAIQDPIQRVDPVCVYWRKSS